MGNEPLSVEAIFVRGSEQAVRTERYLSSLSDTAWAELRAEATRTKYSAIPALRCGYCGRPVYAREQFTQRRHCYHAGSDIKNCAWSSAAGRNLRSVDAEKFQGNQEGERHKALKNILREILALDPNVGEILFERYTKGSDGHYAFPDVFASHWRYDPAAFEIQLATTQLPAIVRREDFYKDNRIRLCWIVGDEEQERLFGRLRTSIFEMTARSSALTAMS